MFSLTSDSDTVNRGGIEIPYFPCNPVSAFGHAAIFSPLLRYRDPPMPTRVMRISSVGAKFSSTGHPGLQKLYSKRLGGKGITSMDIGEYLVVVVVVMLQ